MSDMTCIEFRRRIGAEPDIRKPAVLDHATRCPTCRRFREEMREFDRSLSDALRIPVPEGLASRVRLGAAFRRRSRGNRVAAAAGVVLVVAAGLMVGLNGPSRPLGSAVLGHIYHEPELLVETDGRVGRAKIARVLERVGFELRGGLEDVSHAGLCYFRGRLVSHLVVNGREGPVTILALPDVATDSVTEFAEDGFRGTIIPVERGSIAIVGVTEESLEPVRRRIADRIARSG